MGQIPHNALRTYLFIYNKPALLNSLNRFSSSRIRCIKIFCVNNLSNMHNQLRKEGILLLKPSKELSLIIRSGNL